VHKTEQAILKTAAAKIAEGLRLLASAGLNTSPERVYRDFFRQELIAEIRKQRYKTNDLVTLSGGLESRDNVLETNA
jgi:hypothetical protein